MNKRVYWGAGISIAVFLISIVIFVAWTATTLKTQQQKKSQRKNEQNQIAEQLMKLNNEQADFSHAHDFLALLEEYQDLSQLQTRMWDSGTSSDRMNFEVGRKYQLSRIYLESFFSRDELIFMKDRRNQYTKRYGELLRSGATKCSQEIQERVDKMQNLLARLRALEAQE